MKKIKTVLTAIVMLFTVSAFAMEPEKVTPKVKAAFENDFSKASQVNWEKTSDFYFASFMLNNVRVDAAYNETGELVGTARVISAEQVPLGISLAVAEKYNGYKVDKTAIELTYEGQTRYYINVEGTTHVIKLKCFSGGDIEVESKLKK